MKKKAAGALILAVLLILGAKLLGQKNQSAGGMTKRTSISNSFSASGTALASPVPSKETESTPRPFRINEPQEDIPSGTREINETTERATEKPAEKPTARKLTNTPAPKNNDRKSTPKTTVTQKPNAASTPKKPSAKQKAPTRKPVKKSPTKAPVKQQSTDASYILNKNTKKFHYPWCPSVEQMKEKNKIYYHGPRQRVINKGYKPCKRCNP